MNLPSDIRSKPVAAVLGLGRSGEAAARLLAREGFAVTVLDASAADPVRRRAAALADEGVVARLGPDAAVPAGIGLAVVSPGIPADSPWIAAARAGGARVVSELEAGASRIPVPVLAVTGSNGKSTLVKWLVEALTQAGLRAAAAGNCGPPVCALAGAAPALDWLVLEVSSFQLETVDALRPAVAILLNLAPNHLDRHGTFEAYAALKARLFARMRAPDTGIVPADRCADLARRSGGAPRWVTFGPEPGADRVWKPGGVWHAGRRLLDLRATPFDNPVLGPSAAAAVAAMEAAGAPLDALGAAARAFVPLPHRMEPVGDRGGVRFVNDSKATSLAALLAGLEQAGGPVRLIAGGLGKGEDYGRAKERLAAQCRAVYLIGKVAGRMAAAWSDAVPCEVCATLDRALARAAAEAAAGEVVLLSPGCASYDQFNGFEERGDAFRRGVAAWCGRGSGEASDEASAGCGGAARSGETNARGREGARR